MPSPSETRDLIDSIYRSESRRVFASLVRLLRDFDLAEEALHEAFAAALERWAVEGPPANPRTWLVSVGRFKAIDVIRRRGVLDARRDEIVQRIEQLTQQNAQRRELDIEDDQLRLIFACCHPALDSSVQIALTLREVCGLTTEEIAGAFFTSTSTMAQRLARGKAKIRDAGIPFTVPEGSQLVDRLDAVLAVVYLVYNEGYAATAGDSLTRPDLSREAIRLGRLLVELLPDPESTGLLALMLLHESRRATRTDEHGDLVLLEAQDRQRWDQALIAEGSQLVQESFRTRRFGAYTLQAAISAVHASAPRADLTDWPRIVSLYDALLVLHPSPIVQLNRAVAVAMRDGPAAGLALVDALLVEPPLDRYHLAHAARADLCRRLGEHDEASRSYRTALSLAILEPERRFLTKRIESSGPLRGPSQTSAAQTGWPLDSH